MIGEILDFILTILEKFVSAREILPTFKISPMYLPGTKSNPLCFICSITNKSTNKYIINDSLICKINHKQNYPLVEFKAKILLPPENFKLTRRQILESPTEISKILANLSQWSEIDSLVLKSKQTKVVIFIYEMRQDEYKNWSNFELKMINPGMILDEGVIPAWFECKFEWELLLRDENNVFWSIGDEKNPRSKEVDYLLFQEKRRLVNSLLYEISLGNVRVSKVIRLNYSLRKFRYSYLLKKFAYRLRLRQSL